MIEAIDQITANAELIVFFAACLVGVVKRDVLKIAWDIDKDGDVDNDDVRKILSTFSVSDLAKVSDKAQALDAKYLDAIYNVGSMSEEEARSFLCAMFEIAGTSRDDRNTLLKLIGEGRSKDIDYIFENVDIDAIKALSTAFKQLNMTAFLTDKDPSPQMKEKLYQVVKTSLAKDSTDLNALQKVLAA